MKTQSQKTTIFEIKNLMNGLNNRLEETEESMNLNTHQQIPNLKKKKRIYIFLINRAQLPIGQKSV